MGLEITGCETIKDKKSEHSDVIAALQAGEGLAIKVTVDALTYWQLKRLCEANVQLGIAKDTLAFRTEEQDALVSPVVPPKAGVKVSASTTTAVCSFILEGWSSGVLVTSNQAVHFLIGQHLLTLGHQQDTALQLEGIVTQWDQFHQELSARNKQIGLSFNFKDSESLEPPTEDAYGFGMTT